jgi:peptidyl-prolyl cis-trans isomerase A (cyclophilin A)
MKLSLLIFIFGLTANAENPVVIVETNKGNFEIELNADKAPVSVQNFLDYVDSSFYDKTIFHRVVKDFVVQGGGHNEDMFEKPTKAPIVNEAKNGLSNVKYSVGMARDTDVNSATSQFYINTKDNVRLDYKDDDHYGYAVFGQVIKGTDVIDAMNTAPTQTVGEFQNVPIDPIVVQKISIAARHN